MALLQCRIVNGAQRATVLAARIADYPRSPTFELHGAAGAYPELVQRSILDLLLDALPVVGSIGSDQGITTTSW